MKYTVSAKIPPFSIEGIPVFAGLDFQITSEMDKEEFLATLPHLVEMEKIIMPEIRQAQHDIREWFARFGSAVWPDLMALVKGWSDNQTELNKGYAADTRLDRELEREIKRAALARDYADLKYKGN